MYSGTIGKAVKRTKCWGKKTIVKLRKEGVYKYETFGNSSVKRERMRQNRTLSDTDDLAAETP